ncbi:iron-hydroxamate ABC transporter substrate-binding protein [Paenibacillus donghaensis]|uniref:Fe/B12 periplasmic-binding domain-containing protein n=1 Tax=Paenibacillus donghaensis TaxID=414771 RepID=A0A2Z2KEE4_9BACL|nr:iron-hydroxamate ABC transporter substrate-binding protein [Paenibacillus donghaensis]ASA21453.1 hypothetical protein B9T62_12100 [Paenibacillus donghaensis]
MYNITAMGKMSRIAFALILVMILSACGQVANQGNNSGNAANTANAGNAAADESAASSAEQAAETEEWTYESDKGSVQISRNPQRVVLPASDFIGDLLTLDVTPIGVTGNNILENPYFKEPLAGVEVVGDDTTLSLEKIITLNPDLIITYQEENYEQLSKIAPTVFIPWGKYNYKERLIEIGKILNKEQQAVQWVADFDKKLEDKKAEIADLIAADKKVAIFEIAGKELYLYGSSYGRGGEILYNGLGLHAPKIVEEAAFEEGWASVSHEALPEYLGEADYIFQGFSRGDEQDRLDVMESPIWKSLPAVQAGHVFTYDLTTYYFSDAYALNKQLDEIIGVLKSFQ